MPVKKTPYGVYVLTNCSFNSEAPEPTLGNGKKLSELLKKPVYRVCPDKNGCRSYMDYYSYLVFPVSKTEKAVVVITASINGLGINEGLTLEFLEDTDGWDDFTPIHELTMKMAEKLGLSYSFDAMTKYEEYLQKAKKLAFEE